MRNQTVSAPIRSRQMPVNGPIMLEKQFYSLADCVHKMCGLS